MADYGDLVTALRKTAKMTSPDDEPSYYWVNMLRAAADAIEALSGALRSLLDELDNVRHIDPYDDGYENARMAASALLEAVVGLHPTPQEPKP